MGRSATVLGLDVLAPFLAVAWMRWGVWLNLYGYSLYRNRRGHWIPRPPAAVDYFQGFAWIGTLLFIALFVLTSCAFFYAGIAKASSGGGATGGFVYNAFYGGIRALAVKYSAFVFSIAVSPAFYFYMWNLHHASETTRIVGGFAMTALSFTVLMLGADWWIARRAHHPQASAVQAN